MNNMENNTLLSHELEEMRSQIGLLKEKLEKQTIVNEQHIRRSMKSKMSDLTRTVAITIFAGVFALVYSTWFFWWQELSLAFIVATAVMLTVCIALTILQRVRLKSIDLSQNNLVEAAKTGKESICCGGSLGSLTLTFDRRRTLTENALRNLTAADPEVIVTACPLCLSTFNRYADRPVRDIAEIINEKSYN